MSVSRVLTVEYICDSASEFPVNANPGDLAYARDTGVFYRRIGDGRWVQKGVPVGGIIGWSGTFDSIPIGFAVCNGVDNAPGPDLSDEFIPAGGPVYIEGIGVKRMFLQDTAPTSPAIGDVWLDTSGA